MNQKEEVILYLNQFKNKGAVEVKETYIQLMNALRNDSYKNLEEYERKAEIIRECYDLFNSHQFRTSITPQMSNAEIYDLYLETKLDDKKRKYDMSELFNPDLIGYKKNGGTAIRTVAEISKEGEEIFLLDSLGRKITIKPIGALGYENALKTRSNCTKYLITKQGTEKSADEYEVYSEINFQLLSSNEEYRRAVTNELLSDRNIKLSKANGYIGKIEQAQGELAKEKLTSQDYIYQVSDNFALHYDAEELSAVGIITKDLKTFDKKPLIGKVLNSQDLENYGINLREIPEGEER